MVSLLTAGLLFNCPPRPLPVLGTEPGSHRCFSMESRGPKSLWESLELKDTTSAVGVCKRISQVSLRARFSGAGQLVLRQGLCLTRTHQFSGYPSSWGLACLWPLPPALGLQVTLFSLFMQGLGTKLRSWCLYGKHLHMEWSPSPLAHLALLSLCTVENKTLLDFDLSLTGGLLIIFNDNKKLEQMKEEEGML